MVDAQKQAAKLFSDFNELTCKTWRGVLESQTELFRLETSQASKAFLLPKVSENPEAALSGYLDNLHTQTEQVIAQARQLNDIWRNYSWGLLSLAPAIIATALPMCRRLRPATNIKSRTAPKLVWPVSAHVVKV